MIFLQLLLVVLCITPAAPEEWDYSGGILDREEVLEKAARATREKYPEDFSLQLAGFMKFRYNADGTYISWYDSYIKYLTERALSENPVTTLSFTIPHQRGPEDCKFTLVEIIKPDGSVLSIDPKEESKVKVDRSGMDSKIYSQNTKNVEVGLPGLEVGDILHTVSFERVVEPYTEDNWGMVVPVQISSPGLSLILEICGPEELPLQSMIIKNRIEETVVSESRSRDDGLLCYRWEWRDVPSIFPEPNMPPLNSVKQRLLVSTLPDWKTFSRRLSEVYEPHLETDGAIKARVQELTRDLEDPGEKIKALFLFVSQKIGYLGIAAEASDPGIRPHDVTVTFKNRMGICRDQAALLVAMLREAGFVAFPALISVHNKVDPEVPLPVSFDHVITALREQDGDYLLLDPTPETTSAFLSPFLKNRNYLVGTPAGEPLLTSPPAPTQNNTLEINTRGEIDRAGALTAETVFLFNGVNDTIYRSAYANASRAHLFRNFQEKVLNDTGGASLSELVCEPEDLTDISQPLTVRIKYRAENFLVRDEEAAMVPLPFLASKIGVVNELLDKCKLKKRRYPLANGVTCGVRERITLNLERAVGEEKALPISDPIDTETVSWKLSSRMEENELRVESDFQLKTPEFTPDEYLVLREAIEAAEQDRRQMAIFSPISPATPILTITPALSPTPVAVAISEKLSGSEEIAGPFDVLYFYKRFEYNLEDAYNWTETRSEKKQILSYQGIKSESLLKISNPYLNTEVEIEKAIVIGPDGSSREVGENNISRYYNKLIVAFPGLEVGSTIEYRYTMKARDRIFSTAIKFIAVEPTREIEILLKTPRELPLSIIENNFHGVLSRRTTDPEDPNRRVYEWKCEDLPILKSEDSRPPLWTFKPSLFISTGNWDNYASRVEKTLTKAAGAKESRKEDLNPGETVSVIRDRVDRDIRIDYATLPPFSSVDPAAETYTKGVGTRVDRAVVIYSLLESFGFKPEFVLASSFPDIKEIREVLKEALLPFHFSDVLVRVRDPEILDGRYVYLNDTDRYAVLGATTHNGMLGVTLPGGDMIEISSSVECDFRKETFFIRLAEEGAAVISYRTDNYSPLYGENKKAFSLMRLEERRRAFDQQIVPGKFSPAAALQGELSTDFSGYPGVISLSARDPNFGVRQGDFLLFTLPHVSYLMKNLPEERLNPWYIEEASKFNLKIKVELPPGFEVVYMPESMEEKDVAGVPVSVDFQMKEETKEDGDHRLLLNYTVKMEPAIVDPTAYQEIREVFQCLRSRNADTVLLKKTTDRREK